MSGRQGKLFKSQLKMYGSSMTWLTNERFQVPECVTLETQCSLILIRLMDRVLSLLSN